MRMAPSRPCCSKGLIPFRMSSVRRCLAISGSSGLGAGRGGGKNQRSTEVGHRVGGLFKVCRVGV